MSTSRYVSIRPNNIPSDGRISFKNGFPTLSFTIQSQSGVLDPKSIRIAGEVSFFKDNLATPTPILTGDTNKINMDNRLGIYNLWDQLIIRHNKSKTICEHLRHYPRYLSSYLGLGSSKQDLMGHLNETELIMPNSDAMFERVMVNNASGSKKNFFSCKLPCGFIQSGNMINLMETSFGGIEVEIHLTPDQQALFSRTGSPTGVQDAHYVLENLEMTYEVHDIPSDQMSEMASDTQGALEFNTITALYTTINSTNAQLQFNLGLKSVQSVFMNFVPSDHINTIQQNGHATTYPSNLDNSLVHFTRVQWLRGGVKYPEDFDTVTNISKDPDTTVVDPKLLKNFVESVIPEYMADRTSVSVENNNRDYNLGVGADTYLDVAEGGALMGLGIKYSQFNTGQNFKNAQWGCSLESNLTTDNPISVYIYVKAKATLLWNSNGIQLLQ